MKVLSIALLGLVGIGLLPVVGCDHERTVVYREHHPREVVVVGDHPDYIIVREAPPPRVVEEVRPHAPSGAHVWVDGYWHHDGRRYVWERSHWAVPPAGRPVWVAPRYERHGDGYRYSPGRWRDRDEDTRRDRDRDTRGDAKPDRRRD